MRYVDIAIPANNKGKHSIGALFWLLARMVLQMRGTISAAQPWDVMVDLFFYREPEETKEREEDEGAAPEFAAVEYAAPALGLAGEQWGPEAAEAGQWEPEVAAVPASGAVPAAGWDVAAPAPAGWDTAAPAAAPAAPAGWEPAAAL